MFTIEHSEWSCTDVRLISYLLIFLVNILRFECVRVFLYNSHKHVVTIIIQELILGTNKSFALCVHKSPTFTIVVSEFIPTDVADILNLERWLYHFLAFIIDDTPSFLAIFLYANRQKTIREHLSQILIFVCIKLKCC